MQRTSDIDIRRSIVNNKLALNESRHKEKVKKEEEELAKLR